MPFVYLILISLSTINAGTEFNSVPAGTTKGHDEYYVPDPSIQCFVPVNNPGCGTEQTDDSENPGKDGEQGGEQTDKDEENYGFRTFRKSPEIVKTFVGQALIGKRAAFCHDGISQKTGASADKRKYQKAGCQTVAGRVSQGETEHHGGVEQKIEADVEKGPPVGGAVKSGQATIDPVSEAVEQDKGYTEQIVVPANQNHRQQPQTEGYDGDLISPYPFFTQKPGKCSKQRFHDSEAESVEHDPFSLVTFTEPQQKSENIYNINLLFDIWVAMAMLQFVPVNSNVEKTELSHFEWGHTACYDASLSGGCIDSPQVSLTRRPSLLVIVRLAQFDVSAVG